MRFSPVDKAAIHVRYTWIWAQNFAPTIILGKNSSLRPGTFIKVSVSFYFFVYRCCIPEGEPSEKRQATLMNTFFVANLKNELNEDFIIICESVD